MTAPVPTRDEVLAMLATFGDRRPQDVAEGIDSLELAWLIHQLEQHYGAPLDLADEDLARMTTVAGTLEVLAGLGATATTPGLGATATSAGLGATATPAG